MRKFFIFFLFFCGSLEAKLHVLVSIAPQKFLVEKIGKENVFVEVIVPPGANSHAYEPSARQVMQLQKGQVWFRIGEGFEGRLISAFTHTLIIDQRQGLDLIQAGCGCCIRDAHDPHIWLSPRLLKKQAIQIADALIELNPQHTKTFKENLSFLIAELEYLDQECDALMSASTQKTILVSHPAFGYFCKDYGLEQLSIEMEGKDPTPRYVTELIAKARNRQIKKVFLQKQHNPKGGKRIAQELKAKLYDVDPYCENVIENLRNLAKWFSDECH